MTFIDMFCGIGGFRYGLEKANQSSREYLPEQARGGEHLRPRRDKPNDKSEWSKTKQKECSSQDFTCVWANDNDRYACQISRIHYPNDNLCEGDIRTVDVATIPEHDLLCAGFPCQSFSIAGKRRGFEDTRGTLFFEICKVIRAKRPGYLLLENVKGLLSHDDGTTFQTIIRTLDELGYDCQWQVLNSKDYGVPQNRERVFIVGHTRGKPRPKVFPIGETDAVYTEANESNNIANSLDANYGKGWLDHGQRTMIFKRGVMGERNQRWLEDGKEYSRNFPQGQRVYDPAGISAQLNAQGGGWGAKTGLYEIPETLTDKGINGIMKGKGGHYASTQEANTIEVLRTLWEEIGTKAFTEWGLGILDSLQQKKILQSDMYGNSTRHTASKEKPQMDDSPLARKKAMSKGGLLYLWETQCKGCSPQKPRLARQFIGELTASLSQLPQQDTSHSRIRRLTPMECERLQGFPDGWTEGISDTQRYKCLGNAVTVNVIEAIGRQLLGGF